jgi:hypothetical protein
VGGKLRLTEGIVKRYEVEILPAAKAEVVFAAGATCFVAIG